MTRFNEGVVDIKHADIFLQPLRLKRKLPRGGIKILDTMGFPDYFSEKFVNS